MPKASLSFSPRGHGKLVFLESPCKGTLPIPLDCSCSCTTYNWMTGDLGQNLSGKNQKYCSCSCGNVWWKCNSGTYFGGNLVSVCFLQIKSDVYAMKNSLPKSNFLLLQNPGQLELEIFASVHEYSGF